MADTTFIPMRPENYPASVSERNAQQGAVVMAIDSLETLQEQAARDEARLQRVESALQAMLEGLHQPGLAEASDQAADDIPPQKIHTYLQAACELIYGDARASEMLLPAASPITGKALAGALRQTLEGLRRTAGRISARRVLLSDRLAQALTISAALTVAGNGLSYVLLREVQGLGVAPHPAWFYDFDAPLAQFNFQKLNHTDIAAYFSQGLE